VSRARNEHNTVLGQLTPTEAAIEQANIGESMLKVGNRLGRDFQARRLLLVQGADIEGVAVQVPLETVFYPQPVEQ